MSSAPTTGTVREWYQVDPLSYTISHCRATYYEHCEWKDHPWGLLLRNGAPGAPFVQQWAIEREHATGWHATARSDTEHLEKVMLPHTFPTKAEARAYLRNHLQARLEALRGDLRAVEARMRELG